MTHTVIRKNFVLALALVLTVGHPLAALAEDANTTQNTQDTLSTNQSVSQIESNMANRFYFAVGIGLGWGGPGTNPNQLFGFVPLTLSFGWSWMFNQYFGIRPYVSGDIRLGAVFPQNGSDDIGLFGSGSGSFNIDALANFYVNKTRTFHAGGVIGLGISGGGGGFIDAEDDFNSNVGGNNVNAGGGLGSFGNFHINVGLKAIWKRKHGVELMARIPMITWGSGFGADANVNSGGANASVTQNTPYANGISVILTYSRSL